MFAIQKELAALYNSIRELAHGTNARQIELSWKSGDAIRACVQSADGGTIEKQFSLSGDAAPELAQYLKRLAYPWPDIRGAALATAGSVAQRLLVTADSKAPWFCSLNIVQQLHSQMVQFLNIDTQGLPTLRELVDGEFLQPEALAKMAAAESGLVFTNGAVSQPAIDALALTLAAHPEAVVWRDPLNRESATALVGAAAETLVVVASGEEDPVTMYLHFRTALSAEPELQKRLAERVIAGWAAYGVRRTCQVCAKPTPVDSATLNRIPAELKRLTRENYLFGRGCSNCDQTFYRGVTLVNSWLDFDDSIRAQLNAPNESALYSSAYLAGTRALLEEGVRRIFEGFSSFEETLAMMTKLPAGLVTARSAGRSATPKALSGDSLIKVPTKKAVAAPDPSAAASILLVEDDKDQRKIIEAVFKSAGYDVRTADNGSAALESLASQPTNLIICDVMMPVMSGGEFVRHLRASAHRDIPVLMLTAMSNSDVEFELLDIGADDYCEKSVKRKVLLKRVEKLLQRSSGAAAPRKSNSESLLPE